MAQIKKDKAAKKRRLSVNLDVINTLVNGLKFSDEEEIELQYYGRYGAEAVQDLGRQHGLYRCGAELDTQFCNWIWIHPSVLIWLRAVQ